MDPLVLKLRELITFIESRCANNSNEHYAVFEQKELLDKTAELQLLVDTDPNDES
jgi:hypothetical protein